ncbi:FAD/NAD(P)-binding protein [Dyella caseinilytica]|uniref:FAD/NAD(P)-binding protein n=1 Tax=Dyella caseinilytica TaxID=1849581 RepID=A0ABX7GXZ9_9GAMM|nr:FAD/NAD(P)-binding protein [Dyella caseinilytica]QRN54828.1 FAD/NAD(P)-binding protein [Dyella caseinilytica]GFZ97188.1 pyridine nucleotide-disulfide oxidoreductase [Dyella caseinilytica]
MADIAIIGGGAAGAALFGALLNQDSNATVHWITGASTQGRGVAYATPEDHHLLNVRAAGMGLYVDQDEDFVQHATRQRAGVRTTDFLPRRLFGDFIEAQVRARIATAEARGRAFALHAAEALRVDPQIDGYDVLLADKRILHVDAVILAVGALSPRPLRTVSNDALASGAYELNPWNLPHRNRAPRRMIVIGTGLTAVDTLISASTQWPDAELVAVSRHGLLPFVHPTLPAQPYPQQNQLNAQLLACHDPVGMVRAIRQAMRESPQLDWRSVIDGMRPINATLWQRLTLAQRRQFLRHARWIWEASRHRIAPPSAEIIQQLRDEGRLQVHAARVLGVDGQGPLDVTVRARANQVMSTLQADLVVQATGLDTAVAFTEHALLSQLIEDGLAVADPLQLGVAAHPDGRLINARGDSQPGLYAIGSLLRGNLWECTAMPEIRAAAHALAANLAALHPAGAVPISAATA